VEALENINKALEILKNYNGENSFIIDLKNKVYAYKTKTLNNFDVEYILMNHDRKPIEMNKLVKVADWWGEKQQLERGFEFTPKKVKITWFMGETKTAYHFFCIFRKSQERATEIFVNKSAILTNPFANDWQNMEIDFNKYDEKSGKKLFDHQKDAVKFLVERKKAILADQMGMGKSISSIVAALEGGYERVLIICPASIKLNWKRELMTYVDESEITIVSGNEWEENKFTIINYDILKNFYEVPTTTVKKSQLELDDTGKVVKVVKEKEQVSRKKEVIEKAMESSQLYKSKFDLIIIDEAHRLSNTTSGIFKIVSDLVKRSKPNGIFELTGTPITNKPINFFNLLKLIDAPVAKDWQYYVERYCDGKHFFNKKERAALTSIFLKNAHKSTWYDLTQQQKWALNEMLEKKCHKIWVTGGASNLEELQEIIKPYYIRRDKTYLDLTQKIVKLVKYDLNEKEREEYNKVWEEFAKDKDDADKMKHLLEGVAFRQWLANTMVQRTVQLTNDCLERGEKVVIFTTFDAEQRCLRDTFKELAVVHNGKMTAKQKEKSVKDFQEKDDVKIFIGNMQSAGVGITLTAGSVVIFNSINYLDGDLKQAEDRIHRLNQDKDCTIYYQVFNDTYMEHMFYIVHTKEKITETLILNERQK